MSVYTDFQKFVHDLEASSTYSNWCSHHGTDCATWQSYRTGLLTTTPSPNPPSMATSFGKALVDVGIMAVDAGLVAPPPPPPLDAEFSFSSSGLVLTVTDHSTPGPSGPIVGWHWDFGDGNTSNLQNPPPHTYASSNTYTVSLTVTGTSPDGTSMVSHPVTVSGGGGSILDQFLAAVAADSDMDRPTTKPSSSSPHYKPFTTIAQMESLLASAVSGDYIFYNGSSVLLQTSAIAGYQIINRSYSGTVTLDLGTSKSLYDPSQQSSGYVRFAFTGSGQVDAFTAYNNTNLVIYGGEYDSGIGGAGIRIRGANTSCGIWDYYVTKAGSHGIQIQPADPSSGAARTISNSFFRGETARFCMNPAWDTSHADRGTGFHGVLWHDTNHGTITGSKIANYSHDPLRPGEVSAGKTWGEGGGGSAIEIGTVGDVDTGNTIYILGENLLMVCNGTNPGSNGAKQTAGNGINWWGTSSLATNTIGFVGLINSTGQSSHGTGGTWSSGGHPTVEIGRHSNTNQAYPLNNLSSSTDSYDRRWGIDYVDCT